MATTNALDNALERLQELDPHLASKIIREVDALRRSRKFGLVFEKHLPESVRLTNHPVKRGVKVALKAPDKGEDGNEWTVSKVTGKGPERVAHLVGVEEPVPISDLVVVREFGEPVYPGLKSVGRIDNGPADAPCHAVINGENFHALQALNMTHRGKVDLIYIDPPYNTRAKDWKYNNDYVDPDDAFAHSKWLTFMERRLRLAKHLLKPSDSALIVAIDEREVNHLGVLLQQVFPNETIQMVSVVISPSGGRRAKQFRRSNEFLYYVLVGDGAVSPVEIGSSNMEAGDVREDGEDSDEGESQTVLKPRWTNLVRSGTDARRRDRPNQFFPIYVTDTKDGAIKAFGDPLPPDADRSDIPDLPGCVTVWPLRKNGTEGRWQVKLDTLQELHKKGYVKVGRRSERGFALSYLREGERERVESGVYAVKGTNRDGSLDLAPAVITEHALWTPTTTWSSKAHSSADFGPQLLDALIPGRSFPFPKSLYSVEDALRFFVASKPQAVILDFFGGSGTTTHAVMRLNRQDGGRRQSILVTNNEVSEEESKDLRTDGYRPGDEAWEALGIFEHVTKPRITATVLGRRPDGTPVEGSYKFTDEFPMRDGFPENVEFFELTYLDEDRVSLAREFEAIAPLLWMQAGGGGGRIDEISPDGYAVTDRYAVLFDVDATEEFIVALAEREPPVDLAFIVTDSLTAFESASRQLPQGTTPHRLYESYLRNFEINTETD